MYWLAIRNQSVFMEGLSRPWPVLVRPYLLYIQVDATAATFAQGGVRTREPGASIREPGKKSG